MLCHYASVDPGKRVEVRVQAKYEAAEVRVRHAQEALTQQEAEAVKLEQRLAAAREQYDSGLAKLRSTARQLESLASQVRAPLTAARYSCFFAECIP